MNNDQATTAAGILSGSGLGAFAFLPYPWNLVGAGVAAVAHVVLGYYSNKPPQK